MADAAPVQVYAAGSLREAFTEIARDHEARTGQKVALTFGASGLLRERIEKGEPAQVFASADPDHPQRLAARGGWQAPVVFTRNALCALTRSLSDLGPSEPTKSVWRVFGSGAALIERFLPLPRHREGASPSDRLAVA